MAGSESVDSEERYQAPRTRRASEVKPRPVEWLWADRIPLGKLTLLDGDPGTCKTTLLLDLAARVKLLHGYLENQVFAPSLVRGKEIVWKRAVPIAGRPYLARAAEVLAPFSPA